MPVTPAVGAAPAPSWRDGPARLLRNCGSRRNGHGRWENDHPYWPEQEFPPAQAPAGLAGAGHPAGRRHPDQSDQSDAPPAGPGTTVARRGRCCRSPLPTAGGCAPAGTADRHRHRSQRSPVESNEPQLPPAPNAAPGCRIPPSDPATGGGVHGLLCWPDARPAAPSHPWPAVSRGGRSHPPAAAQPPPRDIEDPDRPEL